MAERPVHLLLDDDERQFIKGLFAAHHAADSGVSSDMWLTIPEESTHLQQLLEHADAVYIQMQLRHYTLYFHPRLEVDAETGVRYLNLGLPDILDPRGTSRGFRLDTGNTEVHATDVRGHLGNLAVANISITGAALVIDDGDQRLVPGKTRLCLRLDFPDSSSLTVEGKVVRRELHNDQSRLAMKFTRMTQQKKDKLNAFIYEHALDLSTTE